MFGSSHPKHYVFNFQIVQLHGSESSNSNASADLVTSFRISRVNQTAAVKHFGLLKFNDIVTSVFQVPLLTEGNFCSSNFKIFLL